VDARGGAQGSTAAEGEMKKRGGVRKGGGRPRGSKNLKRAADVGDREVMTLQEVAEYLQCHYSTALRLARQREIPGFRLVGDWRFLKSDVNDWIAKGGGQR
jgi:excisionase family DNA binding protein